MLRHHRSLIGAVAAARDGIAGRVIDFLFHDHDWTAHYGVVRTGDWSAGRTILVSREIIERYDRSAGFLHINTKCAELSMLPALEVDPSTSIHRKPPHNATWRDSPAPGSGDLMPLLLSRTSEPGTAWRSRIQNFNPHLRSVNEVSGYELVAPQGIIGSTEGFLIEDSSWRVPSLIAFVRGPSRLRQILISPEHLIHISAERRSVAVDCSNDELMRAKDFSGVSV